MQIISVLVSLMMQWVPPTAQSADYESIAWDAYTAMQEEPIAGLPAESGAVLLLAIASYESLFLRDVDEGRRRGDNGKAVCLGQVHTPAAQREIVASNRSACFAKMRQAVNWSFRTCRRLEWQNQLAGYTVGRCVRNPHSRAYMTRWANAVAAYDLD